MQKQESARSSTFHKLKSLEPCWVSTQPICSIRFIRFTTTHKGHASFSPGPNLPISFPRPLKPSDSSCRTLAAWMVVHESCWSIENQRVISVTPVFFPNPKNKKKTREPIHSHLNPWQYRRLHGMKNIDPGNGDDKKVDVFNISTIVFC